nr:immunoglobulin heavy chain junction region [Mus musculus]
CAKGANWDGGYFDYW